EIGEGVHQVARQLLDLHALVDELLPVTHLALQGLVRVDEVHVHAHERKREEGEHIQQSKPGCLGGRVGHEHHSYLLWPGAARRTPSLAWSKRFTHGTSGPRLALEREQTRPPGQSIHEVHHLSAGCRVNFKQSNWVSFFLDTTGHVAIRICPK